MAGSIDFGIFAKDHASAVFEKFGKNVGKSEKGMTRFSNKVKVAGAVAGAAVAKFVVSSVKAYAEADKAQRKLEDAYARFPRLADVNIKALRAQADAIQAKTGFDNDSINASQAVLAQYKLTGTEVLKLTPLLVDYAAKTGKSLPDASKVLGKAILGNGKALKDIGIKFKDTGSAAGNLDELMAGLRSQVGGFAEKEGKTAAGKAAILATKMDDFKEAVGERLTPALSTLMDKLIAFSDWVKTHQELTKNLVIIVLSLAAAFKAVALANAAANTVAEANPYVRLATGIAILAAALVYLYKKFAPFRELVDQTAKDTVDAFRQMALAALGLAQGFLIAGKIIFDAVWTFMIGPIDAFLTVMSKLPFGVGKPFAAAKKALDGFKGSADDAFNKAMDKVRDWERTLRNAPKVAKLKGDIKDLTTKLNTAQKELKDPNLTKERKAKLNADIASLLAKIRAAQAKINGLTGTTVFVNLALQRVGGDWEKLRGRQHGGPVSSGQPYVVGERGPELFMPNRSGTIIPNNRMGTGGGGVYINEVHVHGVQSTSELWKSLQMYAKRNGSIKLSGITA